MRRWQLGNLALGHTVDGLMNYPKKKGCELYCFWVLGDRLASHGSGPRARVFALSSTPPVPTDGGAQGDGEMGDGEMGRIACRMPGGRGRFQRERGAPPASPLKALVLLVGVFGGSGVSGVGGSYGACRAEPAPCRRELAITPNGQHQSASNKHRYPRRVYRTARVGCVWVWGVAGNCGRNGQK